MRKECKHAMRLASKMRAVTSERINQLSRSAAIILPVLRGEAVIILRILREKLCDTCFYVMRNFNAYLISHAFAISFGIMPYKIQLTNKKVERNTASLDKMSKGQKAKAILKKLSVCGVITNIVWMYLYLFEILAKPLSIDGYKLDNQVVYVVSEGQPWNSWFALQNFSVNLLNTINLVYVWYRLYPLPDVLEQLNEIDRELVKAKVLDEELYGKLINWEWACIGGTNFVTISCYMIKLIYNRRVFYTMDKTYSAHLIILQLFCYTKSSASISMFCALFTKLRLRHKTINEKLRIIFERVQEMPAESRMKTISGRLSTGHEEEQRGIRTKEEIAQIEYQLKRINHIYHELVVKQEEVMSMFQIDLLVGMTALSVGLGVDIFLILYKIMYSETPWRGLFSLWQAILFWNLYLTFNAGDYLYSEARKTRTVLTRYNRSTFPELIKTEIRCFLLRIKYKLPTISVYSMYDLSFSTVPSMVTGMASYVIILLQYEWIKAIDGKD